MKSKLFFLLIPVLIAGVLLCPKSKTPLPKALEGTWITDDTRYQDRFLRLSQASVIFGTGESNIDVYFITNVEPETVGTDAVYNLTFHRAGEGERKLSLVYNDSESTILRFLNQPQILWTKTNRDELSIM